MSRALIFASLAAGCGATLSGCGSATPSVKPGGNFAVSSNSTNFGTIPVGQTAKATISVSNTGGGTLQLSQIQVTGSSFSVAGNNSAPVSIPANQSYSLTVQFAPTAAGPQSGTLLLASDAAGDSAVTVDLSGTGEATTPTPGLTLSAASVSFGNITLNTPATQSVKLTSSGTAALTISAGSIKGTGFSMSGVSFPITLSAGESAALDVQFNPGTVGTASGSVSLTSNAGSGGTSTILLSGTGVDPAYEVELDWSAPGNSSDPIEGYQIYRAAGGSASFLLLNATLTASTSYLDGAVTPGTSYEYYVVSVDSSGLKSVPSNLFAVTVP